MIRSACILSLVAAAACSEARAAGEPPVVDAHVHLTSAGAVTELLRSMDQLGVARSVIVATPDVTAGRGGRGMEGYAHGNEVVLSAARAHPERLVPFVTLDVSHDGPQELKALMDRGACGIKLYDGHRGFHDRSLDSPEHRALLAFVEDEQVPLLLHVNTVRYLDELRAVLWRFPKLPVVCAHYCGCRTDAARLRRLMDEFPALRFDTSSGSGPSGIDGFMALEANRKRIASWIAREPSRFVFGSDLVTADQSSDRWREHVGANLDFLRSVRMDHWRRSGPGENVFVVGPYEGLALSSQVQQRVLGGNAQTWLARCQRGRRARDGTQ